MSVDLLFFPNDPSSVGVSAGRRWETRRSSGGTVIVPGSRRSRRSTRTAAALSASASSPTLSSNNRSYGAGLFDGDEDNKEVAGLKKTERFEAGIDKIRGSDEMDTSEEEEDDGEREQ